MRNLSPCSIDGCDRPVRARGWCAMHYLRWITKGDVGCAEPKTRRTPRPVEAAFWANVDRNGPVPRPDMGPCWVWTGMLNPGGYGYFNRPGLSRLPHRLAYEWARGPIPDGLDLDHLCHLPPCTGGVECPHRRCVNPDHLDPVTRADNTRRSPLTLTGANIRKTHCPKGHPYDEANTATSKAGKRKCRECNRIKCRARYHANKARAADGSVT